MKIKSVSLKNFGSYPALDFNFQDQGLSLVSGETGAGKSTFMDAAAWILFGLTSKEGSADDIRSWETSEPTEGVAEVDDIIITRTRGPKNDLYWTEGGEIKRGKDITETQKLLEKRLGVTAELFLVGSYLTQFSKADSFFIAKAKERREVLEKIADQEFAINLGNKASEARKGAKKEKESLDLSLSRVRGKEETLSEQCEALLSSQGVWDRTQEEKISAIAYKLDHFDDTIAQEVKNLCGRMETLCGQIQDDQVFQEEEARFRHLIEDLAPTRKEAQSLQASVANDGAAISLLELQIAKLTKTPVCPSCKRAMDKADCSKQLEEAKDALFGLKQELAPKLDQLANYEGLLVKEPVLRARHSEVCKDKMANDYLIQSFDALADRVKSLQAAQNPYMDQLEAAKQEANPFIAQRHDALEALREAQSARVSLEAQITAKDALIASLTWLYDKSMELRGLLMARAVAQIEAATNDYLERFFDAALRVSFDTSDSDKLEVEISNQGYSCPFKSLSGGERTMLKLAFSLSLMRAAQDKAGVSFNMIMLDEPFSGLSSDLKVKAFGLLQQLEQETSTVLVIDHDTELKTQFDKVFLVSKASGHSEIHEQTVK